jgi:NAD(P)-dependent dehydrogenase (short-subunit alcohol dehydrogenase family)
MISEINRNKGWYIVTGANSGIGKAVAEGLARRGLPVVMLCRNKAKADAAVRDIMANVTGAEIKLVIGDLSDNRGVKLAADALLAEVPKISALINNAGIWMMRCELNADGIEKSFYVNHLAPFMLTNLLLERLKESRPSRVVNVNAGLYVFGHVDLVRTPYGLDYSIFRTYPNSKIAGVMAVRELAKRLEGTGVTINAVHPGVIKTGLGDTSDLKGKLSRILKTLFKSPEKGGEPVIYLATSDEVRDKTGRFFLLKKEIPVIRSAKDEALSARLWDLSGRLTGLNSQQELVNNT